MRLLINLLVTEWITILCNLAKVKPTTIENDKTECVIMHICHRQRYCARDSNILLNMIHNITTKAKIKFQIHNTYYLLAAMKLMDWSNRSLNLFRSDSWILWFIRRSYYWNFWLSMASTIYYCTNKVFISLIYQPPRLYLWTILIGLY